MDAKESRAEAVVTERGSDGGAKFAPQYDRSKCPDAGASAFKGDTAGSRPCAVIGPDRVVPPTRDCPKKAPLEPWLTPDPVYRRLPDYPHKMSDHKDPSRNISPRQTFQENMQRIIMPPGYNAVKMHEDPYTPKINKYNVPLEVKYCDVPYNINSTNSDQKNIRNPDHSVSNVNPVLMRGVPQGWPAGSVNVRPLRPYGAPEVLQYPDYANCAGPRQVLTRTHTPGHEEIQQMYPEPYYHENIRFKPYPNIKERYSQTRYEYLGNPNPYPPHPYAHKYEIPKTMPPHTYSGYPPVPIKYAERVPEPLMDGYQRAFSQQGNYSVPIRNPVIHPPYRPVPGNHMQSKLHPYPPDGQHKPPVTSKLPYEPTNKMYLDYDSRTKAFPVADNYYINELPRSYQTKNTIVLPNYASTNMHGVNTHPYYIKDNVKNYEYARLKNMDQAMIHHSLTKLPQHFSPSTLAISPADSNASNETVQTHGTAQEDCGYASQSSVTSVRSIESLNRVPIDLYGRYDYRYGPAVRTSPSSKPDPNSNQGSKSKKDIRQFISSWSEGDDENAENIAKRDAVKIIADDKHTFSKQYEAISNQEQLYVLGLVNVPSEELSKYEHIQKVSKLPENIKGYNSLELLNQFEEAIESSNIGSAKPPTPRAVQKPVNVISHKHDPIPRAVSPLDVEAKISQSVIHKDVGCNFEIKPCSPKMLNAEVATPMQTLLNERVIEKVANPRSVKSPIVSHETIRSSLINKSMKYPTPNTAPSCKMINGHHLSEMSAIDHLKTNYSLQDLESNSGVCLASLPRLDTDIELNFPEVNQQFINANKTDSVITTSLTKDLPSLDVEQSDNHTLKNAEYDMSYQFSPKMENETDFSRLSKYRKLKRSVPNDNSIDLAKAQAARVDSVIIKNPDNTRGGEENSDDLVSGGYFRNESQEFAMNLVSQAKNSKTNTQHEMDQMLRSSSSTSVISRYDETDINSRSNSATPKSGITLNKSFNVIEDSTCHIVADVQSEDLTVPSEDSALNMPMNLSPQFKFSMVGENEEMKNNTNEKNKVNATSDLQRRPKLEKTSYNKHAQKEQLNIRTGSLEKADHVLIPTNDVKVNIVSAQHYPDSHDEHDRKPNTSMSECASSEFIKQQDDEDIYKNCHMPLHTDQVHASAMKTISNDQELEPIQIDRINVKKDIDISMTEIDRDVLSDKRELGAHRSDGVCSDNIYQKNQEKELDVLHVHYEKKDSELLHKSSLKRKKNRADVTYRKRSTERTPTTITDCEDKKRKVKTSLNSEKGNSVVSITYEQPMMLSDNVVSVEKEFTDNSSFTDVCVDTVQNKTNDFNSETAQNAATEYVKENVNDALKNIDGNIEVSKDNTLPSNLPVMDKCLEHFSELKKGVIPQTDSPVEIGNEITQKPNEKQGTVPTLADLNFDNPFVSSKNVDTNASTKILLLDQPNESPEKSPVCNKFDTQCEEIKVDTLVLPNQEDSQNKEQATIANIYIKNKELDTKKVIDINEKQTNIVTEDKELNLTPCKSDKGYQDTLLTNIDTSSSECELKNGLSQKTVNKNNLPEKNTYYRAYVSKELFSPRFQNLLTYIENSDDYSSVGERKNNNLQINSQNKQIVPYQPVIRFPEICVTHDIARVLNTTQSINETTNHGDTLENVSSESSKYVKTDVEKESLPNKSNEDMLDKKMDTTELTNISDDSYGVDSGLNGEKSSFMSEVKSFSNEVPTDAIDDRQRVTDVDTLHKPVSDVIKSCCQNIDDDKEFENECKATEIHNNIEPTTNIETDTCSTNFIVIEEPSVTQGQCYEYKTFDRPGVKTSELDRKILSGQNWTDRPRFPLKRSLSDSALDVYDEDVNESSQKKGFMLPKKRKKLTDIGNMNESHLLNIIQSSRRNSISTFANENFSFCILIDDNCIVAEENFDQENNFIQLEDDSSNAFNNYTEVHEKSASLTYETEDRNENNSDGYVTKCDEEKTWVDDVGYEETIETEDIAENIVIGEPVSPKDTELSDYESDDDDMSMLNKDAVNHTSKVKHIYGDNLCTNDAQLVDALYRTPQMDVNKKLMDRESQITEKGHKYYDSDSLEMLLAEPVDNTQLVGTESNMVGNENSSVPRPNKDMYNNEGEDLTSFELMSPLGSNLNHILTNVTVTNEHNIQSIRSSTKLTNDDDAQDGTVHSCESSLDNVFSYIHKGESSSSPEVSSTTSEEKNPSILLKISNCKGTRISEVKSLTYDKQKENSCKLTEKVYLNPDHYNSVPTRPLLTKAAQKYIPPIRESIPDLKVKLALPQQSLMKLQKNKLAKEEPKRSTHSMYSSTNTSKVKKDIPRKVKPKFEDVLKNIDEVQFQMHKEKNKKPKKYIPKVVIKKSENGSHYASTSGKESFNPDLTGRKWQPWVFIEKNQFIDKMALRNKTRAVFSHRRKSYVLAEKFCKYRSISSAKFIISQPKINDFSSGNLKYTIKLKHSY